MIENNKEYYFDNFNELSNFLFEMLKLIKNKEILDIVSDTPLFGIIDNGKSLDGKVIIKFEDNTALKLNYLWWSKIHIEFIDNYKKYTKDIEEFYFDDFNVKDKQIISFSLECFCDEYEINPSTGETRPEGGNYFREIAFNLDDGSRLKICAEDSLFDGYCDVWMEE